MPGFVRHEASYVPSASASSGAASLLPANQPYTAGMTSNVSNVDVVRPKITTTWSNRASSLPQVAASC